MINDPTILRFIGTDGADPEIETELVNDVARSLKNAFLEVLRTIGQGEIKLLVIASPRRGSLEIFFRPEIYIHFEVAQALAAAQKEEPKVPETLAAAAALGTFGIEFWNFCFWPERDF